MIELIITDADYFEFIDLGQLPCNVTEEVTSSELVETFLDETSDVLGSAYIETENLLKTS